MSTKYHELRSRSAAEVAQEQLGFQAEEASQQIDGDILATKRSLSQAKGELLTAESAYPFSSEAVVKAELKIDGYEAGLKRLEAIKQRLFTETLSEGEDENTDQAADNAK